MKPFGEVPRAYKNQRNSPAAMKRYLNGEVEWEATTNMCTEKGWGNDHARLLASVCTDCHFRLIFKNDFD